MSCSFRWFINAKLRTKLLLLVIPTMLLLLCVTLTLSFLVFNQYEAMVYGSTEQILNMAAGEIEDNLMRIESIESSLIGSDEIQSALSLTEPNARRREPTTDYNRLALGVYGKMGKCLAENPFVSSISIYVEDQSFFSGSEIMLESQEDEEDLAWILTEAAEGKGKTVWLPRGDKLLCVKEIRDIRTMTLSPLGVVVMRVDLKNLAEESLCAEADSGYLPRICILSGTSIIFQNISERVPAFSVPPGSGYQILSIGEVKSFVTYTDDSTLGWRYILSVPFDSVSGQMTTMKTGVVTAVVLLSLLLILLLLRMVRSLTEAFGVLAQRMEQFASGDFSVEPDLRFLTRTDEAGLLHRGFDSMARDVRTLVQDNYLKRLLLKDAELKSLQRQLNPHFLFNTLQTVDWMAKARRQTDISQIVEALGRLLRYTLQEDTGLVPLAVETEAVRNYIAIQKYRYQERLEVYFQIPESLGDVRIPKLALQNIVENSIKYALEAMLETCRITISAREADMGVVLTVEDNGPGIDEMLLSKPMQPEGTRAGLGIGLRNIQQRIHLLFSDQYGLRLHNTGHGTVVEIHLPR